MIESNVKISMADQNKLNCSYSIITKEEISIIIILKNSECAIFNYSDLKSESFSCNYLLLKHYSNNNLAYFDFLKLIGKMCKKDKNSKYFNCPIKENNRMICNGINEEHMINDEEIEFYKERFNLFTEFVYNNQSLF